MPITFLIESKPDLVDMFNSKNGYGNLAFWELFFINRWAKFMAYKYYKNI